jgi:hypothetical protein
VITRVKNVTNASEDVPENAGVVPGKQRMTPSEALRDPRNEAPE